MVTNKTKKSKKTLTNTLGKAPNHHEVIDDLSQVLKPIDTSIYGIRQVLAIFHKGTDEVKNYLTFECDILFECRKCRSIFRSLANFILHKRNYCQDRFHTVNCFREDDEDLPSTVDTSSDNADQEVLSENVEKTGLAVVIEKLKEKQKIQDLSERILKEDLSNEIESDKHLPKKINNNILLEKINSNNAAVFQTVLENLPKKSILRPDLMQSEVMEIHGILDKNEAVLDEHGKITEFETNKSNKNNLVCSECNLKFSTRKTLTYHLKYKHNNSRLVYICPECKDSFANAWSVFRHLLKVHRKTHTQVKRLRHQVHNSVVRRDEEPSRKKQLKHEKKVADDENQWLDNIESDKDFQMCGGCGKRFERKAALQSHVQMCTKRIAVCNTIKENNAKRKDEEIKNKTNRPENKICLPEKRKGASKRKPYCLRTYKTCVDPSFGYHIIVNADTENVELGREISKNNCDIEVIQNLEYSDEFNEMNSPLRNNSLLTPLLETIDTEKMLSIIGIPESHIKVSQKKSLLPEETILQKSLETENVFLQVSSKPIIESYMDISQRNTLETGVSPIEHRKPSVETQIKVTQENRIETEEFSQQKSVETEKVSVSSQMSEILNIENHKNISQPNFSENEISPKASRKSSIEGHIKAVQERSLESGKVSQHKLIGTEKVSPKVPRKLSIEDRTKVVEETALITERVSSQVSRKSSSDPDIIEVGNSNTTYSASDLDSFCSKNIEIIDITEEKDNDIQVIEDSSTGKSSQTLDGLSSVRSSAQKTKVKKRKRLLSDMKNSKMFKLSEEFIGSSDLDYIQRAEPYMDPHKLRCVPCQLKYETYSELIWHMSAHFSWFRYQCSQCSFISWSKKACRNHAIEKHNVNEDTLDSVVLEIPDWKIGLMTHSFRELLSEDLDLSGRHTDEIIVISEEEEEEVEIKEKNTDSENVQYENSMDILFSETDIRVESAEDVYSERNNKRTDSIDIDGDDDDLFIVEVPEEIITHGTDNIEYYQRFRVESPDSIGKDDFIPIPGQAISAVENEICINSSTIEMNRENQQSESEKSSDKSSSSISEVPELDNSKTFKIIEIEPQKKHSMKDKPDYNLLQPSNDTFIKNMDNNFPIVRSTRTRIPSIKTSQVDFLYDLNGVIKMNKSTLNQKQKKTVNSSGNHQRNPKESEPTSPISKSLKVSLKK